MGALLTLEALVPAAISADATGGKGASGGAAEDVLKPTPVLVSQPQPVSVLQPVPMLPASAPVALAAGGAQEFQGGGGGFGGGRGGGGLALRA